MNKTIISMGVVAVFFIFFTAWLLPEHETRDPAYDDIYSYHDVCREQAEAIGYTYLRAERVSTGLFTSPDNNCYALDKEGVVRQLY